MRGLLGPGSAERHCVPHRVRDTRTPNSATLLRFTEPLPLAFLFVLIVGLIAGTVSGIVGTGSSIMLMPVLVYAYGPKEAVPIMAVASVMANFSDRKSVV